MDVSYIAYYNSPIGNIKILSSNDFICEITFSEKSEPDSFQKPPILLDCLTQLQEYFEGNRMSFNLEVKMVGTLFQQEVWESLKQISFGETKSYKQIAVKIRNPKAIRAVANAIAKNPLLIIVPCHRIIGSNGTLTGYSGGLDRKECLLMHEKKTEIQKK